jgi:hypothetical protein
MPVDPTHIFLQQNAKHTFVSLISVGKQMKSLPPCSTNLAETLTFHFLLTASTTLHSEIDTGSEANIAKFALFCHNVVVSPIIQLRENTTPKEICKPIENL